MDSRKISIGVALHNDPGAIAFRLSAISDKIEKKSKEDHVIPYTKPSEITWYYLSADESLSTRSYYGVGMPSFDTMREEAMRNYDPRLQFPNDGSLDEGLMRDLFKDLLARHDCVVIEANLGKGGGGLNPILLDVAQKLHLEENGLAGKIAAISGNMHDDLNRIRTHTNQAGFTPFDKSDKLSQWEKWYDKNCIDLLGAKFLETSSAGSMDSSPDLLNDNADVNKQYHTNPHLRGSDQNTVGSFIEEGGVDLSGVNAIEAPVEVLA